MSSQAEILGRGTWAAGAAAGTFLHDFGAGKSHEERLAQVRYLAHMLDDNFSIPGTRIRFGWDSILGFIPGLGDVAGTALALLIVRHAWQTGASKLTLTRMLGNMAADFAIGAIPLIEICLISRSRPTAGTPACWSDISMSVNAQRVNRRLLCWR
jgi:hypothetical protein